MLATKLRMIALMGAMGLVCMAGYAQSTPKEVAQTSDKAWLSLIDTGKYAESWKAASAGFQSAVSEEKWEEMVAKARAPLGDVKSRKLESATETKTLPGAPDGDYVVAKFDTSFEHKQAAVETVVSSKEKDGNWRVAGYFIK